MLTILGYAIPLAFASGLNLYATVAEHGDRRVEIQTRRERERNRVAEDGQHLRCLSAPAHACPHQRCEFAKVDDLGYLPVCADDEEPFAERAFEDECVGRQRN